jgi:hypothetical protein
VNEDNCQCDADFTGNVCQFAYCNGINASHPNVCSGRGSCVDSNNCSCLIGSSGSNCNDYTCFGIDSKLETVCSFGTCLSIDTCNCTLRRLGNNCEFDVGMFNFVNFQHYVQFILLIMFCF